MKAMILRYNRLGRGIDVGWRFGTRAEMREIFWATTPDVLSLRTVIATAQQMGEVFTPPTEAAIAAVTDPANGRDGVEGHAALSVAADRTGGVGSRARTPRA